MRVIFLSWLLSVCVFGDQQNWRDRLNLPQREVLAWAQKDPNKILFTTNQTGIFQLYFQDLKNKKLLQLTQDSFGVSNGAFSPNGQEVLYVLRSTGSSLGQMYLVSWKKDQLKQRRLLSDFPDASVKGVAWSQGGKNVYFVVSNADGSSTIYQYRFNKKKPANEIFRSPLAIEKILFARNERYLAFLDNKKRVSVLDLKTKQIKAVLSSGTNASEDFVVWAHEGEARILVTSDETGFIRPGIFYPEESSVEWLSLSLNGDTEPMGWLADGKEILLLQKDQAQTYLWRYNLDTKKASILFLPSGLIHSAMVRPGGDLWLNFESSERARDLYVWNQKTTDIVPLFPRLSLKGHPVKNVRFTSWDGTRVSGWLLKPAGKPDKKRSGVIFLHDKPSGFAGNIWDPLTLALVDHGYVVLYLNYRGSRSFGKDFEKQILGNPGIKELEDINSARDYLLREENVAQEKLVITGRHYGGYLALMSLTRYPHLWAAGYVFNAIADFSLAYEDASTDGRDFFQQLLGGTPQDKAELYFERSPVAQVDQIQAPVLLVHSENDGLAPKGQMDDFVDNLKALRRKHRYLSFEDPIKITEEFLKFLNEQGLGPAPF